MHMRHGNFRFAEESVARGIAMLDELRAQLSADSQDGIDELYQDGRRRLQELADEAEGQRSSAGDSD